MIEGSIPGVGEPRVIVVPFDDFFKDQYDAVVRIAFSLTGRWSVAEELAQDAFLEAHRRWAAVGAFDKPGGRAVRSSEGRLRLRPQVLVELFTGDLARHETDLRAALAQAGQRFTSGVPTVGGHSLGLKGAKSPLRLLHPGTTQACSIQKSPPAM